MNQWEKEVHESLLDSEEEALKELEAQYKKALNDIKEKIKGFQSDIDLIDEALNQEGVDDATKSLLLSQKRSKIYQKQYQEALQGQVSSIVDKMQGDNYSTIDSYLKQSYEDAYVGTMYSLAGQGIPIVTPIDQSAAVRSILTNSAISEGYYKKLGVNSDALKKSITQEISRGIASGLSYSDIARNIDNASKSGLSNAKRIARTEGHRIQEEATDQAQHVAKSKGADVVKQWDATLDSVTRESHRKVDGEIRELDEKFSNGLMRPGDSSGGAAEVCNCRCTANTRARWALDEDELKTLQDRAEYFGLDKTKNFDEYKEKYLNANKSQILQQQGGTATPPKEYDGIFDDFDELQLSELESNTLQQLKSLSDESGYEYASVISNGKDSKTITSRLPNAVKVSLDDYNGELSILHSHTNATPPSIADFSYLLDKRIAKVEVIGYNNDAYSVSVGEGYIPTGEEFNAVTKQIASEVDMDLLENPNFFNWSVEERNYMAVKEQAYRIIRYFGWHMEGGRING